MKKILFAMAALLGCATVSLAQNNYVATLQHAGEFTHYYGSGALTSAYNAAAEGDTITLSPGTFTSPGTIDKGITLRGTGTSAAAKSNISGEVAFCSTDSNRVCVVEGLTFNSRVSVYNNSSGNGQGTIKFIKNNMSNSFYVTNSETYSTVAGPKVRLYNDFIVNMVIYENTSPDFMFYNCYLEHIFSHLSTTTTSAVVNCLLNHGAATHPLYYLNFYNSVFLRSNSGARLNLANATCFNCMSINYSGLFDPILFGSNNSYANNASTLFVNGEVWDGLTPEAQEIYVGTDGTQIGIRGGIYPWNTKVQYPVVTQFSSDVQTSKEGILNINIEVDGE